jgi:hypothetical protein
MLHGVHHNDPTDGQPPLGPSIDDPLCAHHRDHRSDVCEGNEARMTDAA